MIKRKIYVVTNYKKEVIGTFTNRKKACLFLKDFCPDVNYRTMPKYAGHVEDYHIEMFYLNEGEGYDRPSEDRAE